MCPHRPTIFRLSQFHLERRWWTTTPDPFFWGFIVVSFDFQNQPSQRRNPNHWTFALKTSVYLQTSPCGKSQHKPTSSEISKQSLNRQSTYLGSLPPFSCQVTKTDEAPQVAPISVEQRPELDDVAIDAGGSRLCRCWHFLRPGTYQGVWIVYPFFGGDEPIVLVGFPSLLMDWIWDGSAVTPGIWGIFVGVETPKFSEFLGGLKFTLDVSCMPMTNVFKRK